MVRPFAKNVLNFAREADAVVTCSQSTREDLITLADLASERVHVVYGGVEKKTRPSFSKEEIKDKLSQYYRVKHPFLLYVGTLEPRKNVLRLLRAFFQVANQIPHQMVFVGQKGWNIDNFFETWSRSEFRDRVILTGYVPQSDLELFYEEAEAFLFPSLY
ncbi:MAG: glycosyltransferase, partial [candidate division WOR-3 bacterium]